MSGLEIVGVVFGTIRLVMGALKQYEEATILVETAVEYQAYFNRYTASLIFSTSCYQQLSTRLLQSLDLTLEQAEEFIEKKNYAVLASEELTRKLQDRLGSPQECFAFVGVIKSLDVRLKKLAKRLELDEKLRPPFVQADGTLNKFACEKFFNSRWRKIKGAWQSKYNEDFFKTIHKDIKLLSMWLESKFPISEGTTTDGQRYKSMPQHWLSIRDQAQGLYDRLGSCFQLCPCRDLHRLNLQLSPKGVENDADGEARFIFLLSLSPDANVAIDTPWQWRRVEIELCQLQDSITIHSMESASSLATQAVPKLTITPPVPRKRRPILAQPINDLCALLSQTRISRSCLGTLEYQSNSQSWKNQVFSVPGADTPTLQATSLLQRDKVFPRQKCITALALASAVLQLYDTHWLPQAWDTTILTSIMVEDEVGPQLNLYLSHDLNDTQASIPTKQSLLIRNKIIFALGVVLIELSYMQPIVSLYKPEDYDSQGHVNEDTLYKAAQRLARGIHHFELKNYASAVKRCIFCDFTVDNCDFHERIFREKFFSGVVVPLMEDYELATGESW